MPTILLHVAGMDSPNDEERIQHALLAEPGVFAAVASHTDGCTEIDIEDDLVTIERLVEILKDQGYQARLGG